MIYVMHTARSDRERDKEKCSAYRFAQCFLLFMNSHRGEAEEAKNLETRLRTVLNKLRNGKRKAAIMQY
jgi:hypothetical protein